MLTDIEIAQQSELSPIEDIAKKINLNKKDISFYGNYMAKIEQQVESKIKNNKNGHVVLVTSINPTPAGEGKTTNSIGLCDAIAKKGEKAILALREPSLGPVFGIKGGATGGGYSQVVPMENINLHFTGDMHAITSANNLLCSLIDNHLHHSNVLEIDPRRVLVKRCVDISDRCLRNTIVGLGGKTNGLPREDGFTITVASEVMAILCLSENLDDLKFRLGNILIGFTYSDKPIYAKDINAHGAMAVIMKDAIKPNLVQTLEKTPAIIHGGPFANIAHGCNSIKATQLAMKLADYVVTEAGFGSDLGAEKFLDIKCRYAGIKPSCIVVVATIRALKYNGGVLLEDLNKKNPSAVSSGICNLKKHVLNMQIYGVPVVVCINKFETDSEDETNIIRDLCSDLGCEFAISNVYKEGSGGGGELADKVIDACATKIDFKFLYKDGISLKEKMNIIATKIYGADGVVYTKKADKEIALFEKMGYKNLPVCVAKTQYSLSDDPLFLGAPKNFQIEVKNVSLSSGAGFVVFYTGSILTMPGLPKIPAALSIDIIDDEIKGLF